MFLNKFYKTFLSCLIVGIVFLYSFEVFSQRSRARSSSSSRSSARSGSSNRARSGSSNRARITNAAPISNSFAETTQVDDVTDTDVGADADNQLKTPDNLEDFSTNLNRTVVNKNPNLLGLENSFKLFSDKINVISSSEVYDIRKDIDNLKYIELNSSSFTPKLNILRTKLANLSKKIVRSGSGEEKGFLITIMDLIDGLKKDSDNAI